MRQLLLLTMAILLSPSLICQEAIIQDTTLTFRTYGYHDPDPVPRPGKIYPYYRFDGYTNDPVDMDWKIIVMENDWIKVLIAPEIGGKILGAIEKSTGNEFLYVNQVIKFRDVAMRGPWTSGGIEFNFGSIGHAPATASPVNYLMTENPDGSVSCFLGDMDLSSRTEWRVEVRLPNDKAWFETHAGWYNTTDLSTSKYHWMNAAADATYDLTFYFPGTHYIGHGGDVHAWPIMADGRDISQYAENDYGTYHSYHVIGEVADYFAGYYAHSDFGFGHLTDYALKPGKKIWIWGLSRQGEIWVDLLTDPDLGNGQYTEIQTGLLFNQAGANSTQTPFKHQEFKSHATERFTEYWFPFKQTGGVSDVNSAGVLHLEDRNNAYLLRFCALRKVRDSILVKINDSLGFTVSATLNPLETLELEIPADQLQDCREMTAPIVFQVNNGRSGAEPYTGSDPVHADRPTHTPENFDWNTLQGRYLAAREHARQRNYGEALEGYYTCLQEDQYYLPALNGAAEEMIRTLKYDQAENLLARALSVDTYQPQTNYLYGLVKKYKGEYHRAREAFGLSLRNQEYRAASYVQLSEVSFAQQDYSKAITYASSALDYNRFNLRAYQLLITAYRMSGRLEEAWHGVEVLLSLDPLNHQARFEAWRLDGSDKALTELKKRIQNEFPEQTWLELALYYKQLGLIEEAQLALSESPHNQLISYMDAFLRKVQIDYSQWHFNPFTFPFRPAMFQAISYAEQVAPHWLNRYYLGLMHWNFNQLKEARELFRSCGDEPGEAAFYLARARLFRDTETELVVHDLDKALKTNPDSWRTHKALIEFYMSHAKYTTALDYARKAAKKFKHHTIIRTDLAKAELYNGHYEQCLRILNDLTILPAEGAREGHDLYRHAHLMLSVEAFTKGKSDVALDHISRAREWPENLGVGRPYHPDERIENYLEGLIWMHAREDDRAGAAFRRILAFTEQQKPPFDSSSLLLAFSLQFLGQADQAVNLLSQWLTQKPGDPVANWAAALYAGNPEKAERALHNYRDNSGGTPWNPGGGDPQFRLVYEVTRQIRLQ